MRIGMLFSAPMPPREGIGNLVWNLSRYLVEQGHQVVLITRGDHRRTRCEVIDDLPVWRAHFLPLYPFHVSIHNRSVRALLGRLGDKLDLLHIHSPLVALPGRRLPTLVTVHSPMSKNLTKDLALTGWRGWLIRRQSPFSLRIERRLFAGADQLSAVSASIARELEFYGLGRQAVRVIAIGVDTGFFCPQEAGLAPQPPYFFTASRLAPGKGLDDLLACALLVSRVRAGVRFLVAGSGPLQKELGRKIAHAGLGQTVTLLGQVRDRLQMVELYRRALAYVHPSHSEGLPNAILEAMACGKPVIAEAASGSIDLIEDGVNGLLVPLHQPEALAAAILRLCDHPRLAGSLGKAGRRKACEQYAWQKVGGQYLELYHEMLARRGRGVASA